MIFVRQHPIVQYPEYRCEMDEYADPDRTVLVAHVRFNKFSRSLYRRFRHEWFTFRLSTNHLIFAWETDTPDAKKYDHFMSPLGFRYTGRDILCQNGVHRRLYLSVKYGQQ